MKVDYIYTPQEAAKIILDLRKEDHPDAEIKVTIDVDPAQHPIRYTIEHMTTMAGIARSIGSCDKINAIKEVRHRSVGMGLLEAKLFVEAVIPPSVEAVAYSMQQVAQLITLVKTFRPNEKITAIKAVREQAPSMGLAEAKTFVLSIYPE